MTTPSDVFPKPTWVDLRMWIEANGQPHSKLIARFDPTRGLLQVVERTQEQTFDLSQIIFEYQTEQAKA